MMSDDERHDANRASLADEVARFRAAALVSAQAIPFPL